MEKQLSPLGNAIEHYLTIEPPSWYHLSMLSGVNEGTLSKIKHDKASPTLYTLERIARALNIKVSDIILKTEELAIEASKCK